MVRKVYLYSQASHGEEYGQVVFSTQKRALVHATDITGVTGGWTEPMGFGGWLVRRVNDTAETIQPIEYWDYPEES